MIHPDYCRMMARYNSWQNTSLLDAAATLTEQARRLDRGAFFGSITATFEHLLQDDALWLARFGGNPRPEDLTTPPPSVFDELIRQRSALDHQIEAWCANLGDKDLDGDVIWYPGGGTIRASKPRRLCLMHMFNHQTHHRGQVHAMLTAAGTAPGVTDLPMLPS
ncbi:MAG: DinB family protein [Pseudomonadota bacterium]